MWEIKHITRRLFLSPAVPLLPFYLSKAAASPREVSPWDVKLLLTADELRRWKSKIVCGR